MFRRRLRHDLAAEHLRLPDRPRAQDLDLLPEKRQAEDGKQSADDEAGHTEELEDAAPFAAHVLFTTETQRHRG